MLNNVLKIKKKKKTVIRSEGTKAFFILITA